MTFVKKKNRKQTIIEEIFNAISHGLMIPVSIFVFFIYINKKFDKNTLYTQVSFFLFTLTMFALYFMSCLYHSLSFTKAKSYFQRFDHICIYLLIWGSFAPFLLINIENNIYNLIFFIIQFILIFLGILLKIFRMNKDKIIHLILFLLLGWSGIFVIYFSRSSFDPKILIFLFLGGFLYSLGVFFYKNSHKKYFHFIWHLFVVLGNLSHIFSIYFYYSKNLCIIK